jgi:nitrogen-specific signal transduction histidine kinase
MDFKNIWQTFRNNVVVAFILEKQKWKFFIVIGAILIGAGSMLYTNIIIRKIATEERNKVSLWAQAVREAKESDINMNISLLVYQILKDNRSIPVILVDQDENIITTVNLDKDKSKDEKWVRAELEQMKNDHDPISVYVSDKESNFIYYRDSVLLSQLFYYPYVQLGVISIFIIVAYYAFSSSRKAEQNQVWVGMSKETAHQLGTPISSLIAWVELLKLKEQDPELVAEVEKDVKRLETITERFSKIGATPKLFPENLVIILSNALTYMQNRSPKKVIFSTAFSNDDEIMVPLNPALFEWVIENLCKNAIDAMGGEGNLIVTVLEHHQVVYIDIRDTGKGIHKSKFKTVFQPGFTTKKRGWGLGLSLAKRIIESYHDGKIFVKHSEIGKGTTFRIVLKMNTPLAVLD